MTAITMSSTDTLIQQYLPVHDLVIAESLVVDAPPEAVHRAAADLDFMRVRTPLLTASTFVRGLPQRLRGHEVEAPPRLQLTDTHGPGLPGWLVLGENPPEEIAFGAVGQFWSADIKWKDVPLDEFAAFDDPGWGKIACNFLVRPNGPDRSTLTYECRTATTDAAARRRMARYWKLIRPFVGHIMRATLRTIAADATAATRG